MSGVIDIQPNSGTIKNETDIVMCQPKSISVDPLKLNIGGTEAGLSTDYNQAIGKQKTVQNHSGADSYNCSQYLCICYQPVPVGDCDCNCCCCDCCCDNCCDASCLGDCGGCECSGIDCSGCI